MKLLFFHRGFFSSTLICVVLVIALIGEYYAFASLQNIWVDESTQLSGIRLNFGSMLYWLSGVNLEQVSAPADRMPPFSYALDWLWLRLMGPSDTGFRLFHAATVVAAATLLTAVTARRLGAAAATVVAGFFIFSPKLIQMSVEIRAYPFFFAITCLQVIIFLDLIGGAQKMKKGLLALFGLTCITATYTHFYGILSSSAFFLALGLASLRVRERLRAIIIAFSCVIAASTGILPFVFSAAALSSPFDEAPKAQYYVYLLKLIGDSANVVSMPAAILFFGGAVALLFASMVCAFHRLSHGNLRSFDWLCVVVIAGVSATIATSFVVERFDTMKGSYSSWLLAPIGLLVGVGAASSIAFRPWDRVGRYVAAAIMLAGAAWSTYLFFVNAPMFVHGPERFVGKLYDQSRGPKAIIYELGTTWGLLYFPLVFTHKNEVAQYRATGDTSDVIRVIDPNRQEKPLDIAETVAPYVTVLVVDIRLRTYRDLGACLQSLSACPVFAPDAIAMTLLKDGQWRELKTERSFGIYDTQVRIFGRAP
jgi:hypothetical protein